MTRQTGLVCRRVAEAPCIERAARAARALARFEAANPTDERYPLVLNTGRIRDQWHTMTRTGKSARLSGHIIEPYAELHPRDAAPAVV